MVSCTAKALLPLGNPEHEVLAKSIVEVGLPKIGGWHFLAEIVVVWRTFPH